MPDSLRVGIDATNIRAGGGLTHLREVLTALVPEPLGIGRVAVWGRTGLAEHLPRFPWLTFIPVAAADGNPLRYLTWKKSGLDTAVRAAADVLFVPGGTYGGTFAPFVAMSQNLLPFDRTERSRFGLSRVRLRYHLLEYLQAKTFRRAQGVIFLTETARRVTEARTGPLQGDAAIVPHGLAERFFQPPRAARTVAACTPENPLRILYVSIVNLYKHQWHVVAAVSRLREEGYPVQLDLVGKAYPPAMARLNRTLARFDPGGAFVRYQGLVDHGRLHEVYAHADLFVFASSCETFGMILLEAMGAGLPVACSDRGAMPETLQDAGLYFNPEDPGDIAQTLKRMIDGPALRDRLARKGLARARTYSWKRCAEETFGFIAEVAGGSCR